ncbi:MAG: hypothetical protein ACXVIF_08030 [Halobacteriota archaeon]
MTEKTVSEHFINKVIGAYFDRRSSETLTGKVVGGVMYRRA